MNSTHPQGRRNPSPYPQRPRLPSLIESLGPDGKIRGNPSQLIERYMGLGRDALRDGDNVNAEGFFQHAEHYRRMMLFAARRADGYEATMDRSDRSLSERQDFDHVPADKLVMDTLMIEKAPAPKIFQETEKKAQPESFSPVPPSSVTAPSQEMPYVPKRRGRPPRKHLSPEASPSQ